MRAADKKAKERYLKKLELIRNSAQVNIYETPEETAAAIARAMVDLPYLVRRYFPQYATAECGFFQIEWAWKLKKDKNFIAFAKWFRGGAKSVWNNIIIPFWLWLTEGDCYAVIIGPNAKRACRLLEDLRAEFEANPQIIADFGEQKNPGNWDEALWVTKDGRLIGQALGFGEPCRGLRVGPKRPNYYNCDDLETRQTIKNEKRQDEMVEWVESELLPSMDGDRERLVFSNNWFAEVMFLRKLSTLHPDWYVHEVKAYDPVTYEPAWPEKYTADYYRKKEKTVGILAAHAEYLHDPKPKGKIFTPEQIQWGKMPRLDHLKIIVGHWDVAYAGTDTSDFNAVRIWGLDKLDNFWYYTGYVKQSKMRGAVLYMCWMEKNKPRSVTIHWRVESQFWNDELKRTIKEVSKEQGVNLNITLVDTPRTKKYDRILTLQPRYQNGRIYYNENMKSHADTQQGLKQLYGIEPGYSGHDDAPDADEQAIAFLEKHISIGGTGGNYQSGKMLPKNERI